ncbi:MAG: VCBS domain-containing protein, partial [Bradyrhizobium sp.]|uniref:beta strand repeat-containing protein n=1 Tax=Bradyrhizobium sp. TaxID=376 RepID=UPI0023A30B1A
ATVAELTDVTGSQAVDDSTPAGGAIHFTDIDLTDRPTATVTLQAVTWTGGTLTDAETSALESGFHLTPVTNTNNGQINWTYAITDDSLDFLAAGQTATVTSTVTLDDHQGGHDTATVTVTITGANDVPTISATNGSLTEAPNVTGSGATDTANGTITFADADVTDRPSVSTSFVSADYKDAAGHDLTQMPELQAAIAALETALTLAPSNANANNGSVGWTYSVTDSALDFMAAGDKLTLTYDATVTDHNGGTTTTPITVTITGSNDAPTIAGETNPTTQTIILGPSGPTVLSAGTTTNALGLPTETFDELSAGRVSNNGAGHGNFTSAVLGGATFSASGNAGVVNGSSSVSAAPFIGPWWDDDESGHADTTNYLSIGAGGSETITFTTEQNQFGLYWGSVDSYNKISFYNGSVLVASYSGADVAPLFADGDRDSFSSNGYVEFAHLAPFTQVVLTSSSNAFEVDNISAGYSQVHLAGPITGTITVNDADIGDTLTASVTGNAVAEYNGSTTLPSGVDVSALIASGAITFDTVKTTGGPDVLDWTYNPANANLDFLQPGDKLTLTFNATVSDGHATTANQALTITLVGNGSSVVNGTAGNDTFTDVGGGVTISGNGGHDIYNFNAHFGSATITDFDVSHDVIDISSTLFTSVTALLNSAVASGAFDANTVITDSAGDTITLDNVSVAQLKANPGDFQFTIANGGTFEAGASTSENVVFEGSTGKLTIDTPSSFTGVISGFTGDGTLAGSDQIDLKGIDHNSASFTESFNATNDTLFVSDGTHSTTLHFDGTYQAKNFSFITDNNGGTIVYDPPVPSDTTASGAGDTSAVTANGQGFVFNFAANGHDETGGNPPSGDSHLFDHQMSTDTEAALNQLHDDSHTAAFVPTDSHDPSGTAGAKALWHASDFHFV